MVFQVCHEPVNERKFGFFDRILGDMLIQGVSEIQKSHFILFLKKKREPFEIFLPYPHIINRISSYNQIFERHRNVLIIITEQFEHSIHSIFSVTKHMIA